LMIVKAVGVNCRAQKSAATRSRSCSGRRASYRAGNARQSIAVIAKQPKENNLTGGS
jgi:hypothetical protein